MYRVESVWVSIGLLSTFIYRLLEEGFNSTPSPVFICNDMYFF